MTEKIKRIPTGIPGFDELIGGGLEKHSSTLLMGGSGCGKSTFAMQYIVSGAKTYDEPGIYINFDETRNEVFSHMANYGWDLEKLENENKLAFIEQSSQQVKKMLDRGGGEIENLVEEIKAKRLVFDSLTGFALLFKDESTKRDTIIQLFRLLKSWRTTSLLTAEVWSSSYGAQTSFSLDFLADAVVLVYNQKEEMERKRYLEILKMRGTNHSTRLHPFMFKEGGISLAI
ncbi:MAG: ATPase domain-containing protein [Candidatus Altiarchaeota archaeon]